MKKLILFFALLGTINLASSQNMNNDKLGEIFTTVSDSIQGSNGRWQFSINDIVFLCITDENANRMRIISPIVEVNKLDEEQKSLALVANFHTALDVKYAISDDIMWSAFIHPLKELSESQVKDAVSQVYYANENFGTTFSSTTLVFPGSKDEEEPAENEKPQKQKF